MTIRAAGGVLWRRRDSEVEVALVHRPRHADWTLPKGKLGAGESELCAAVREVREETSAQVAVGRRLRRVAYRVGELDKTVTFWAMRHLDGAFAPCAEVDELRWLPPEVADSTLSYRSDQAVLTDLLPLPDAFVLLVRHAKAGKRSEWVGEDRARPLDQAGRIQARRLADELALFAPTRILSADLVRCRQTVTPLAELLGTVVSDAPAFADQASTADPDRSIAAVRALAEPGAVTVVCSQGETIPLLVQTLTGRHSAPTGKGAYWVVGFADGTPVSADYYD